ncbi:helix-turn-helix domain-containing protein [Methyloparacoccus murrellii]
MLSAACWPARCWSARPRARSGTPRQDLLIAIGSAREVVSRHLKRWENRHWVGLRRGMVELLDPAALRRLASRDS